MRLSVLDQSPIGAGRTPADAITDTLALARACDALGYHRYWLAEHHSSDGLAGTAPEVLIARVAAETTHLRVGSGGVMLPHYSALKVAEQFRVLEALAPGRIDLGVGRAPGGDMRTARALNPNAYEAAEAFPEQVRDLQAWTAAGTHHGITAHPLGPRAPEIWILGSSDYGAQLAAHFGLPYAFAYFFTDGQGTAEAMSIYRQIYRPSERHPKPQATLCIWALVADSREEAEHHALSRERWRVDRARGVFGPLQAPDDIAAHGFSSVEMGTVVQMRARAFVGDVARRADEGAHFELDELVVNTWAHDPAVRRRSYSLLAREFGLSEAIPPSAAAR